MLRCSVMIAAAWITVAGSRSLAAQGAPTDTGAHYARVHGVRTYYSISGTGKPLVLLHGAFSNIETDFGAMIPELARTHRVIGIELQGHGHTEDIDRPLRYAQLADDVAELLSQLKVESADFFGYSLGGAVALHLAQRHPALVHKFVFAGAAGFSSAGLYPGLLEGEQTLKPEQLAGTPWQEAYARMAPHPEQWATLVEQVKELDRTDPGVDTVQLKRLRVPALLIIGDGDIVRPEHTMQMFRLLGGGVPADIAGLPNSQLAVLPGTTHVTLVTKTQWLVSMVNAFLSAQVRPSE
ncbi:MAG: alpha/beta fold hydrolase [Gemmatimonadota bacterium]